jgi:electron transfer flavoprotein beta subunit
LPLLITVNGTAPDCRPRNAKAIQKYKYAAAPSELATATEEKKAIVESREYLQIGEWSAAYVDADLEQCGLAGSPTKVKQIESVVFSAKEALRLEDNDEQIEDLVRQLIANHTIG